MVYEVKTFKDNQSYIHRLILGYLEGIVKVCCSYINKLNEQLDKGVTNIQTLERITFYLEYTKQLLFKTMEVKTKTNGIISNHLFQVESLKRNQL